MTLSKRAIRPHQTQLLLDNGYLPVSVDYRLCPEIDLIAGPMTDVRDALDWVRNKLPAIAGARGVVMDPTKVIAVGWSTGGHLAMTTAWTCEEVRQEPPTAILCFYGPTDFESEGAPPSDLTSLAYSAPTSMGWIPAMSLTIAAEIDSRRAEQYPERSISLDQIRKSLPTKPVCPLFLVSFHSFSLPSQRRLSLLKSFPTPVLSFAR